MRALIFDTETTGKTDFKASFQDPCQPDIVQIGALLYEDEMVVGELNVLVKPGGWEIPKSATAVHGINDDFAHRNGVPLFVAMGMLNHFVCAADVVVAHNLDFDKLVAATAFYRLGMPHPFHGKQTHCTMKTMTERCKLPGPYGFKWPKLEEAYRFLFNEWDVKAHDAMADVRACARIYFAQMGEKDRVAAFSGPQANQPIMQQDKGAA